MIEGGGEQDRFVNQTAGGTNHESECNHWNDRLDPLGKTMLRPIQCHRHMGHEGPHLCGDTSWGEDLGFRAEGHGDGFVKGGR